jgi:plasmid stabilization system protein ParE
MNILWMPAAVADLEDIRRFIGSDNPGRAISFVTEIIAAGEGIADIPRAFPLVPRLEDRGVRRRIVGRYLIFYRIKQEAIEILHVNHSARDYIRSLFDIP